MYSYENWNIKKGEYWRIGAFKLWCWRRLLRVPWTARRSNQSIPMEISPGCSLDGLMLKLKLPIFWLLDGVAKSQTQLSEWTTTRRINVCDSRQENFIKRATVILIYAMLCIKIYNNTTITQTIKLLIVSWNRYIDNQNRMQNPVTLRKFMQYTLIYVKSREWEDLHLGTWRLQGKQRT